MTVRLVPKNMTGRFADLASEAASRVADEGASPRAQIDAAREATGQRLVYSPHQGAKERARRLKRR
jgi:hypothetical protein